MRFPLRDWIDEHPGCRHDLSSSGMRGSIRAVPWPSRRPPADIEETLRSELAGHLGVSRDRLFLSHGASEANGWVLGFLRRRRSAAPKLRVRPPEYPPLFEAGLALGYRLSSARGPADVAVVSQPRNPEGDLWGPAKLAEWVDGVPSLLVDETFREFAGQPSVARRSASGLWATGTFTKFFGGDEVRVGFAIAPPEAVEAFERFVGLISDEISPVSCAMALVLLQSLSRVRREVDAILRRNRAALARLLPEAPVPVGPVVFDRVPGIGGAELARRCLAASVLVCPGELFGDARGVRLGLTRRDAPSSLAAYAEVRGAASARGLRRRAGV